MPPDDPLRPTRRPSVPPIELQDPRTPVWADQVAARRRLLSRHYEQRSRGSGLTTAPETAKPLAAQSDLTNRVYKYSRGVDLTNDEMGYGERGEEQLWHVKEQTLQPMPRSSQLTKSGRQPL
jgi:hypothetical protein